MIVAITPRQWTGLLKALGITEAVTALEGALGVSFARDEGLRFVHRHRLFPLIETAAARLDLAALGAALDANDVCWGPYRTLHEALRDDPRLSPVNPIFAEIAHPSGVAYATPGSAANFVQSRRGTPPAAPRLGQHTDEVLATVLSLPGHEIARLHDAGLVAGA
jgi:2-methylfumaryl-CoA isomerase